MTGVLEIDVGNSRLKWRRIRDGVILDRGAMPATLPLESWRLAGGDPATLARVGSVAGADFDRELEARLLALGVEEVRFAASSDRCGRLRAGYREPARLGVDRWLALVAGAARVEGAFAVLDAGSALTLDLVDADGRHLGGWILPGLRMMRRALLDGTAGSAFPSLMPMPIPGRVGTRARRWCSAPCSWPGTSSPVGCNGSGTPAPVRPCWSRAETARRCWRRRSRRWSRSRTWSSTAWLRSPGDAAHPGPAAGDRQPGAVSPGPDCRGRPRPSLHCPAFPAGPADSAAAGGGAGRGGVGLGGAGRGGVGRRIRPPAL
ncbi:MAG: type III pantothenate kinase [Gammaproteobacteria bacterium]|nr:type III pantothenate kinase [Gammaproteobacteria bacterium]